MPVYIIGFMIRGRIHESIAISGRSRRDPDVVIRTIFPKSAVLTLSNSSATQVG